MDHVEIQTYDVLLSYPDEDEPNVIQIKDREEKIIFQTQLYEKTLTDFENQDNVVPPYNAFSAPGDPLVK